MQKFSNNDIKAMQYALKLAWSVKGLTLPNPAVGAVLKKNGRIIGEGATAQWRGPHAEKTAILQAGPAARGSTLYVTLEPCCHYGKTPPCTDAIIAAGITKVFIALRDPNPLVAGKGIAQLRRNGISVTVGLLRKEAMVVNEDFLWAIFHRRAFITLKLALTLDGRIADTTGNSKWITSPTLRKIVHKLRGNHAAVAVGKGTLIADDPKLTVRYGSKSNPARIVFTSARTIPSKSYFHQHAHTARSIVVVRKKTKQHIVKDSVTDIEYWFTGSNDPLQSMDSFCSMAFSQNIFSVFIEGGQKIASTLLKAGLVNRLYLFLGNQLVGNGIGGIHMQQGYPISECISLKERKNILVDGDVYITGIPVYPQKQSF